MDRQARIAEILDQIGTHNPTDAMKAMRHWPGGRLSLVHLNVLFVVHGDGPMPMRALAEKLNGRQVEVAGLEFFWQVHRTARPDPRGRRYTIGDVLLFTAPGLSVRSMRAV